VEALVAADPSVVVRIERIGRSRILGAVLTERPYDVPALTEGARPKVAARPGPYGYTHVTGNRGIVVGIVTSTPYRSSVGSDNVTVRPH
jgi:hypothetical protein